MKHLIFLSILLLYCIQLGNTKDDEEGNQVEGKKKFFANPKNIFNVVTFPNIVCAGTSGRNGTCYTTSECSKKSGINSGTCANGYGVCCVLSLQCGGTSSDNNTYLIMGSTTSPPSSCSYTICPCNDNICRIRFDFTIFDINPPFTGTATNAIPTFPLASYGGSIGDCMVDTFSISSPGNRGSPQICGYNTGQHMYMDASGLCVTVDFNFLQATYTRQYDIKVTQYSCGDDMGGPPDCLQYFTSPTGTISSFNFRTINNAVTSTATHLTNQMYDICIRRAANMCSVCYYQAITGIAGNAMAQNSYGISNPTSTTMTATQTATAASETLCTGDYLGIPYAIDANVTTQTNPYVLAYQNRICGRIFGFNTATIGTTICSGLPPFTVSVRFDSAEQIFTGISPSSYNSTGFLTTYTNFDETFTTPAGIIGFSLNYYQTCP